MDNQISISQLTPMDIWMVQQNIRYAKKEGVEVVVARLKEQGYHRVATAVKKVMSKQKPLDNKKAE